MTVRSFADTSAVSLAYAMGTGTAAADFAAVDFTYLPFTTEGLQMGKESKSSTAITSSRRPASSKNTKGSASGSVTVEFGAVAFILDLLSAALMNDWAMVNSAAPAQGTYITDGDIKKFLAIEKTVKSGPAATDKQYHERYYGTLVNDTTIELGDGELMTMALSLMSMKADYANAQAGANGLGGSMAKSKAAPASYEIADPSNNLKTLVLKDSTGTTLPVTFSDASLQIQNNAREQSGLGHEFAAGVGFGKVAVSLSGEIYFYDQTVLDAHMTNKRLSAEMSIETKDGTFTIQLPKLVAQTPTNSADGENQDYKSQLTLTAEPGTVTIGAATKTCLIAITYVAKP